MRDFLSKHEHAGATRFRTFGRESMIAAAIAALAGCGEIVPVGPDGGMTPSPDGAPADAVPADNADLALLDLGAFGDVVPAFDPEETSYVASFSLLVQQLEVIARPANPAAEVSINGVPVTPGRRSAPIPLAATGDTPIEIEVRAPAGNRKTYAIVANHGAPIRQYVYGKASNPGPGSLPASEFDPILPGDLFGFWMDVSGDTLVVGAPFEDSNAKGIDGDQDSDSAPNAGAAYVFRRQDNAWKQEAYLKASNTDAADEFGHAVAIDGDLIAVGAPYEASNAAGVGGNQDSDGLNGAGAVYLFRRIEGQWRQEAYVKPSDPQVDALFGAHLALDGDLLVVGAPGEFFLDEFPGEFPNDGAVYVFRHDGATWVEEAILKASNGDFGHQFGFQVSVDGDIIAVGAIGEPSSIGGPDADPARADDLAPLSGAVYVFERQQDGAWQETAYIKPQDPGGATAPFPECIDFDECEGDRFGVRVELEGDTLVVGAHFEDSSAREIDGDQSLDDAHNAGAAWVFRRNDDGGWRQEAYLKPSNLDPQDFFGQNLELSGDLLAVAANGESSGSNGIGGDPDNNGAQSSGAVYLFRRDGGTWQQLEYIKASNTERFDNFGFNMCMSENTLVVGAVFESGGIPGINGDPSDESAPVSGAFYIFQ